MKITASSTIFLTQDEVDAELWGEGWSPPPIYCEKCGGPLGSDRDTYRDCWAGNCVEILCGQCGTQWAGNGPVRCPCQSRHPRLRRIRQMYARRRR